MVENELQFVGGEKFRRMVPSIIRLEISRLEGLMEQIRDASDLRNAIVKARFELTEFAACLREAETDDVEETCAPHLETALLTVSMLSSQQDDEISDTLAYVADRLEHVHERMKMIY